jgi:hypothetical protein
MHKLIFRAASLLAGMVGGLLAGTIFKEAWQLAAREDQAPHPPRPVPGFSPRRASAP